MAAPQHHVMDAELLAERETMRYHCPVCQRCIEDGPDGVRVLHHGDRAATHRGGSLAVDQEDVAAERPSGPTMH